MTELRKIKISDPVKDASLAIRGGDIKFFAVYGYALVVPGIADYDLHYSGRVPLKVIEGTSDSYGSKEEEELNRMAIDYAMRYNLIVLKHIKSVKK